MIRFLLIFFCAFYLSACATTYNVSVSPTPEQTTQFFDGARIVVSERPSSVVAVVPPSYAIEDRGQVGIVVINLGPNSIDFGTENISANAHDDTQVRVYSYAELMAEEKRRQAWAAVAFGLSALGNSMQAANAGRSTSYGSFSGNTYGAYGGSPYSATTFGSGYVTTYDPAKAQAAQALANQQNSANLQELEATNAAKERELQSVLKITTLSPGQSHSGTAIFDFPKESTDDRKRMYLLVTIGSDEHIFDIELTPSS